MRNFTAGEWKYLEWPMSFSDSKEQWYLVGSAEHAIGFIRHEEDARLIAAAPKMYELLGMAMWSLRDHSDNDGILAYRIGKLLASIDGDSDVKTQESEP